jgi:hypothetical protein
MDNILDKDRITITELRDYYKSRFPYEPNDQRIGRFAKSIGLKPAKQMIKGKLVRFYVKVNND